MSFFFPLRFQRTFSSSIRARDAPHQKDLAKESDTRRVEALSQAGDERALALLRRRGRLLRSRRSRCCCCGDRSGIFTSLRRYCSSSRRGDWRLCSGISSRRGHPASKQRGRHRGRAHMEREREREREKEGRKKLILFFFFHRPRKPKKKIAQKNHRDRAGQSRGQRKGIWTADIDHSGRGEEVLRIIVLGQSIPRRSRRSRSSPFPPPPPFCLRLCSLLFVVLLLCNLQARVLRAPSGSM